MSSISIRRGRMYSALKCQTFRTTKMVKGTRQVKRPGFTKCQKCWHSRCSALNLSKVSWWRSSTSTQSFQLSTLIGLCIRIELKSNLWERKWTLCERRSLSLKTAWLGTKISMDQTCLFKGSLNNAYTSLQHKARRLSLRRPYKLPREPTYRCTFLAAKTQLSQTCSSRC